MEYIVASLVLLLAIAYAVVIAVNIEKGKGWALEIAHAISMLDPQATSFDLRTRALEAPLAEAGAEEEPEVVAESVPDRIAA